jgi:type IV secretion system protein VirB10
MPTNQGPRGPSLLERRMMNVGDAAQVAASNGGGGQYGGGQGGQQGMMAGMGLPGYPGAPLPNGGVPINGAYSAKALPEISSAEPLTHPDTLMLRGTFIRCVLETRIITDIPGFTSCVVTEPVYSFTGKRLLLPKGSKVMGKYEMEPNGPRVAVIWDRVVTPTGIDVNMASPGIDTLGGAGHPGYYNAHWGSRIGSALLISMLSDAFKYEAAEHGPKQTTISNGVVTQNPFESNTASTLQQISNSAVQRAANRPATVTINQGTVLAIYVAKDVDFSGVVSRY